MRIERLTSKLQMALSDAQSIALGQDHSYIESLHLLMALLDQQGGSTRPILQQAGVQVAKFRDSLDALLDRLPKVNDHDGNVQMSPELGRLMNLADKEAQKRKDQFISSELVLMAMFDGKDDVAKTLKATGVTKADIASVIDSVRGGESVNDPNAEENRQALDKYTVDLTTKAAEATTIMALLIVPRMTSSMSSRGLSALMLAPRNLIVSKLKKARAAWDTGLLIRVRLA